MRKKTIITISAITLIGITAAFFGYNEIKYRTAKAVTADAVVLIPTDSEFEQLADSLEGSSALAKINIFIKFAKSKGLSQKVRPGRYQLRQCMSYAQIINMFKSGNQSPVRVTFNNVRSLEALAGNLSGKLEVDSASLASYLTADSIAAKYGFTKATFIGMFIPNTYDFYWNTTPENLVSRLNKEYEQFWSGRDAKLAHPKLTRQEVSALASIVYEETKMESEMATVAGVYINRLRKGMLLQADPTVKFALNDPSIRRILFKHLEVDSPYNTYKYGGLIPGPICMPSIKAIDAVLNYQEHNYIYFCAKDDLSGAHSFAVTLSEHNRNAQAYARALNRLGIR